MLNAEAKAIVIDGGPVNRRFARSSKAVLRETLEKSLIAKLCQSRNNILLPFTMNAIN